MTKSQETHGERQRHSLCYRRLCHVGAFSRSIGNNWNQLMHFNCFCLSQSVGSSHFASLSLGPAYLLMSCILCSLVFNLER